MRTFLHPLIGAAARRRWMLRNERTGIALASHVETAFDSATRRRGLLGRDALAEGHALVIAPCNAVHTWFMRFPIDVLFAARDGRVVAMRRAVSPWRIAWALRGFATIELPAGALERGGTEVGDRVTLTTA